MARRIRHLLTSSPIKTTSCILTTFLSALYRFADIKVAGLYPMSDNYQKFYFSSIYKCHKYVILRVYKRKARRVSCQANTRRATTTDPAERRFCDQSKCTRRAGGSEPRPRPVLLA